MALNPGGEDVVTGIELDDEIGVLNGELEVHIQSSSCLLGLVILTWSQAVKDHYSRRNAVVDSNIAN